MSIQIKPNRPASAFDPSAQFDTQQLVKHLAGFVQTSRLHASSDAKQPLLADLSDRAKSAASAMRTTLNNDVPGLAGAPRLPAETLVFMHELRAAGFDVRVTGHTPDFLNLSVAKGKLADGLSIDVGGSSQGYLIRGTRHEKTFEQIISKMTGEGTILKSQGDLFGGGHMWRSFEGTGVRA